MLNFVLTTDGTWRAINAENFFKVFERQNLKNQKISELYTDLVKKSFMKHFPPRRQLPKLLLRHFLAKLLTKKFLGKAWQVEQESYLSYIKNAIRTILQTTDPYAIILKNQLQKTLDAIIGENQSATFYTICDIIDVSKPLLELNGILSFLLCKNFGYGDKFINMIKVALTNFQSKIKINVLLSDAFTLIRGVCQEHPLSMLLYIIAAKVLVNFNDKN